MRSMETTLEGLERAIALSRTRNVIIAGDYNAKHPLWGPCAGDERGTRLLEFMAPNRLIMLNDPQSQPTYETKYAASWIDVTMVTPSVVAAGYSWAVRDDLTYSEHRNVEVQIGAGQGERRRRLTTFAQHELLESLRDEQWFARVHGADLRSAEALDAVLSGFQLLFDRLHKKHLRQIRGKGNPWWTPQLAQRRPTLSQTVQAYADDTVILVAARSRDELGAVGSEVLARVI
ncbi:hypothetical protein HPB49_014024 [Dermacentor silvarum]|uniref:Uncharacterized protein n=1 Tax=Dermacentor silvarum TaxID=543639 RepID=A0ACB8C3Z3_DERSI|nr:hypothetical protein HPB49_014024 [Dermacentor silvarum]